MDYGNESNVQNDGDETVATSASRRSILNPHGLSTAPPPPTVERRSHSRGKERGYAAAESFDDESNRGNNHERRPRSRNRRGTGDETNISSAQALINRRREMRERIAERQNNALEKRHNRSTTDMDENEKASVNDLANAMLHEWSDVATPREPRSSREKDRVGANRRGRSRSVVRDGLSKIRSASLNAFRKSSRSVIGDDDGNTVDTGKKSTSSSIFSRIGKKNRSLSRGRSVVSEFDARSDCRSDSFALHAGGGFNDDDDNRSSRSGMMRRFSLSKNNTRSARSSSFKSIGSERQSNSFNRETLSGDRFGSTNGDGGFSRSSLMRTLSKTSQSQGMVRSLSRNNIVGDGLNEYDTTRSESFATNHADTWFDGNEMQSSFAKRPPTRGNPFDD